MEMGGEIFKICIRGLRPPTVQCQKVALSTAYTCSYLMNEPLFSRVAMM